MKSIIGFVKNKMPLGRTSPEKKASALRLCRFFFSSEPAYGVCL